MSPTLLPVRLPRDGRFHAVSPPEPIGGPVSGSAPIRRSRGLCRDRRAARGNWL